MGQNTCRNISKMKFFKKCSEFDLGLRETKIFELRKPTWDSYIPSEL